MTIVKYLRGASDMRLTPDIPDFVPEPYSLPTSSTGIAKTALPANRAVNTAETPNVAQAFVDQAARMGIYSAGAWGAPTMNVGSWSGLYYVVPVGQPEVRVKVLFGDGGMVFVGHHGVPIPDVAVPQGDEDSEAFIYQPGDRRGTGNFEGTYWEFWGLTRATPAEVAEGYTFSCYQLARMVDANNNIGRMFDYWWQVGASYTDPSGDIYAQPPNQGRGVYQDHIWGALAIGANPPGACLMVHPADILRGYCDHPIGVLYANCRSGAVWPAQRGDGWLGASYPLVEGQWYDIDPNMTMPTNLSPLGEVIFKTCQLYGLIGSDTTGGTCLAMRASPDCAPMLINPGFDGRNWSAWAFQNFPWSSLRLLAQGSDANFHPTT